MIALGCCMCISSHPWTRCWVGLQAKERVLKCLWYEGLGISNIEFGYANSSIGGHFKLSKKSCPTSDDEKKKIECIPYSSIIGVWCM